MQNDAGGRGRKEREKKRIGGPPSCQVLPRLEWQPLTSKAVRAIAPITMEWSAPRRCSALIASCAVLLSLLGGAAALTCPPGAPLTVQEFTSAELSNPNTIFNLLFDVDDSVVTVTNFQLIGDQREIEVRLQCLKLLNSEIGDSEVEHLAGRFQV